MKNILILLSHPDDEIVGSCIFIRRKIMEGHKIFLLFLTNGVIGRDDMWFWKKKKYDFFLEKRMFELKKSMELLKIKKYFVQNIPTRTLRNKIKESYLMIKSIIKEKQIDILLTPAYEGGHQDHDVTNFIASKFKKNCKVLEFSEYHFNNKKISSNCFIELQGNEVFINLNNFERDFKKKAIQIYESEKNNVNYIEYKQECFRPIVNYNYFQPPHSGTLFYRRFSFFSWHPRVDSTLPEDICRKFKNSAL